MNLDEIHAAIPHREPFLLVDEIVEQTDSRIVCRKTFHGDEFWYRGHYPDYPITPGVLLCEAGMQAGAILLAPIIKKDQSSIEEDKGSVPIATRLTDVRFKRMVFPGETIEMDVELTERIKNAFFLQAKITVDGKVAVRFHFACAMAQPE